MSDNDRIRFKSKENQLEIFRRLHDLSARAAEAGFQVVKVNWHFCPAGEEDAITEDLYWASIHLREEFFGEDLYVFNSKAVDPTPYVKRCISENDCHGAYSDFLENHLATLDQKYEARCAAKYGARKR